MTSWYADKDLPSFERPPVIEAALGIEFAVVPGLGFSALTRLHDEWADEYPQLTEMPLLPPVVDQSGSSQFQIVPGVIPVRTWSISEDSEYLVQAQPDRLFLNWRKTQDEQVYPHYPKIKSRFLDARGRFFEFLSRAGMQVPTPLAIEFTYVNRFPLDDEEHVWDAVSIVSKSTEPFPGESSFVRFQVLRTVHKSEMDPFEAQITVNGEPQFDVEDRRSIQLSVSTKVFLSGAEDDTEFEAALDAAHSLSSHSFVSATTASRHELWGRKK